MKYKEKLDEAVRKMQAIRDAAKKEAEKLRQEKEKQQEKAQEQ